MALTYGKSEKLRCNYCKIESGIHPESLQNYILSAFYFTEVRAQFCHLHKENNIGFKGNIRV